MAEATWRKVRRSDRQLVRIAISYKPIDLLHKKIENFNKNKTERKMFPFEKKEIMANC